MLLFVETEPLPPEMQPLITGLDDQDSDNSVIDPVVRIFLKRQKRMQEVKRRREASVIERFQRFASRKYYSIRRGYVGVLKGDVKCLVTVQINYFGSSLKAPDDSHRFA